MPKVGLDSGYSRRALARLAFSACTAELTDRARAQVHTDSDRSAASGAFLEAAMGLLDAAQQAVTRAAILERSRGTSWEVIGEQLGVSRQAAQQRFATALEEWDAALDDPLVHVRDGVYDCRLPDGPNDPEAHVARLERWLEGHRAPNAPEHSVGAHLERSDLLEQVTQLLRQARRMTNESDPEKLRRFQARKAALLAEIANVTPGDAAAAAAAERARDALERVVERAT